MSKIKVKFLVDGDWMDEPSKPIFSVVAGEEREVSASLANVAIEAGKAEFVKPKQKPGPKTKAEKPPASSRKKKTEDDGWNAPIVSVGLPPPRASTLSHLQANCTSE